MLSFFSFTRLLFFEAEYHDDEENKKAKESLKNAGDKEKQINASSNSALQKRKTKKKKDLDKENGDVPLLDIDNDSIAGSFNEFPEINNHEDPHKINERNTSKNLLFKIYFIALLNDKYYFQLN